MIRLTTYQTAHYKSLNYVLSEAQAQFTAPISHCIHARNDLEDDNKTVATILFDEQAVGFFVVDIGDDKSAVTDNTDAALIRSFSLNPEYQGKGIGCEAMVKVATFIRDVFPHVNELALSVNVKNTAAYRTYIKAGYIDNGKQISGSMGNQHVLTKCMSA